jgi:threonine 3-dehydrogenase
VLALRKIDPGYGGLAFADVPPPPSPAAGEALLRVTAAGICGTDLHIFEGGPFSRRMRPPTTLGHEICGVIEAVGPDVSHLSCGQRVSVESHLCCERCYACRRGWSHVCPNTRYPGVDFDGGFASHVLLPARIAWPVPDDISDQDAAMMEPFGIAVHASMEGTGVAGAAILIAGCGPIGLMNIAAARALGATTIIASDISAKRVRAAARLGADRAVDVSKEDLARIVADLTGGRGVDVAIEYSGQPTSLRAMPALLAHGGELRVVGVAAAEVSLAMMDLLLKGITVRNIHGRRLFSTWEQTTALLRRQRVVLDEVVSHRLPLANALDGFEACRAGSALKVLLTPPSETPMV